MTDPNGLLAGSGQPGQMQQSLAAHYAQQPAAVFAQPGLPYSAQLQQLSPALRAFWEEQMKEIQVVGTDPAEFKNHSLPLARIKKIMKSDEDVRMISAEAPVLFAKACEMFILELTLRSWHHSEENKRRTLQRNDIAAAITRTDIFDFLVDIVPREERGDDGNVRPAAAAVGGPVPGQMPGVPYMQYQMPAGMPGQGMDPNLMAQQQRAMAMDPAMMQQYWQHWTGMQQAAQQQQQGQPQQQGQQAQQGQATALPTALQQHDQGQGQPGQGASQQQGAQGQAPGQQQAAQAAHALAVQQQQAAQAAQQQQMKQEALKQVGQQQPQDQPQQ